MHLRQNHLSLATLILLFVCLVQSAGAQQAGGKTATELWLDAHRDPHEKKYFGALIDLSLRDADLIETLRSFAEIGRFNLVIQPGVQGKVTVELKRVPWDQALEQILKIHGLGLEITGGEVSVDRRSSKRYRNAGFALVTVRLDPVYADAGVIARAFNRPAEGVPSGGGAIRADGDTLVIRDTRDALMRFARVLRHVDVPPAANESQEALARRCVELWNRHVPERPIGR